MNIINELRFGNWYIFDDEPKKFTFQDVKDMEFENSYLGEPLPLNEEWLIKLGFKKKTNGMYSLGIIDVYTNNLTDGCLVYVHREEPIKELCCIYFVHTLQNLYLSLTGVNL